MELLVYCVILQLLTAFVSTKSHYSELLTNSEHEVSSNKNYVLTKSRFTYEDEPEVETTSRCQQIDTIADCVRLGLKSVPDYLDSNITFLDLSHNKIESLAMVLNKYYNLVYLNISYNSLQELDNENFVSLNKLLYLNLYENNLAMNDTFPQFVFRPLTSLTILRIDHNNKDLTRPDLKYPDTAMSELKKLTELFMDGLLNQSLGPGFKNMTSLKHLTLAGPQNRHCSPLQVQNDTFINVPGLEFLNLTRCCLNGLHMASGLFHPLTNLKVLDISGNEQQCLDDLIPVLRGLQESNIVYLGMSNVINVYTPCVIVTNTFVEILPKRLRSLIVSSNSFAMIEDDVMEYLPKTLSELDVSDNRFTFGAYLQNFTTLENLKILIINKGTLNFNLPTHFPDQTRTCKNSYQRSSSIMAYHVTHSSNNEVLLPLPYKLDEVKIESTGWSYSLTKFSIDPNNTLRKLSLVGNNIPNLFGPFTGLVALEELDLMECNIYTISDDFFKTFPSLIKLNLSTNYFGTNSLSDKRKSIFKFLTKLTHLDLSFVNILTISKRAFEGLVSLEYLWLHNNAFYYFDVHISHMINLHFIDFRFTELATLNTSTIEAFNNISKNNNNLSIDLSESPIHCYCANMFFLDWIVKSTIFHKNLTNYKCVFLDTSEKYMNTFDTIYHMLLKQCKTETALFIAILAGTLLVLSFLVGSIMYRFRWKLRYLYYSAYLSLKLTEYKTQIEDDFKYDAFMSYVSDDQSFVIGTLVPQLKSRGIKVHVHAYDFIAGEYIASNIVNAIQSSRHTLVVLTRSLLKSIWCKYELQMANMEHVHTGRPVLVFLLMEHLTKKELGTELLYHIQNNTYVRFPEVDEAQNEQSMEVFWTKLATDLRS